MTSPGEVNGCVQPEFESVGDAFALLLAGRPGFGAALCIYVGGEPQVDLWGGGPYRPDSVRPASAHRAIRGIGSERCSGAHMNCGWLGLLSSDTSFWKRAPDG
jgi:hypothetical protein